MKSRWDELLMSAAHLPEAVMGVRKISDGCYLTMPDDHVFQFFILLPSGEVMDAIEVNKR